MKTVIMIALLGIASADCEAGMSVAYYKDENCKILDPDYSKPPNRNPYVYSKSDIDTMYNHCQPFGGGLKEAFWATCDGKGYHQRSFSDNECKMEIPDKRVSYSWITCNEINDHLYSQWL